MARMTELWWVWKNMREREKERRIIQDSQHNRHPFSELPCAQERLEVRDHEIAGNNDLHDRANQDEVTWGRETFRIDFNFEGENAQVFREKMDKKNE